MSAGFRLVVVLSLVAVLLLSLIPGETVAIPYKIEGYLKDSKGLPITLANISLSGMVFDAGLQDYVTSTVYMTTDASGYFKFYTAAMEPGGYNEGSTLTVSYTGGDGTVTNQVTVTGLGAWANLTYEESRNFLDVVASPVGAISVVVLVTAVVVVYYIFRPPAEERTPGAEDDGTERPKKVERRRKRR